MINLPHIDPDLIANELDLEKRAINNGSDSRPLSDSTNLDEPQQEVLGKLRSALLKAHADTERALRELTTRRAEIAIRPLIGVLRALESTAKINIDRIRTEMRGDLKFLAEEKAIADARSRAFRRTNHLYRGARYPESDILHWSLIAAVVLIESMANSYFFAQGSDLGLLGGLLQAILISAVNISIAMFSGVFGLRFIHHVDATKKAFGSFILFLYSCLTLVLNLSVSHYRVALELDPESALRMAFKYLLNRTFEIENFDAALLLLIGILSSAFALVKSYNADDVYPGYGRVDRETKAAAAASSAKRQELHNRISEVIDDTRHEVSNLLAAANGYAIEYPGTVTDSERAATRFKGYEKACEEALHDLLDRYRVVNREVRPDREPAYFKTYPDFGINTDLPTEDYEVAKKNMNSIAKELREFTKEADNSYAFLTNLNAEENMQTQEYLAQIDNEVTKGGPTPVVEEEI